MGGDSKRWVDGWSACVGARNRAAGPVRTCRWPASPLAVALGLVLLAGCAAPPVGPVGDAADLQALAFLQQSSMSRQEVEARMGLPTSVYEQGRIVTYGLRRRGAGWEVYGDPSHYLVILYRPDDTVEVWSLVNPVPYR
jgi:hypothetical protein